MTTQRAAQILYVCGGRSFVGENLGRKIGGIADCWRRTGHDVKLICGGDIRAEGVSRETEYGSPGNYTSWYRRKSVMAPLVATLSEWRDIQHDKLMLRHLQERCAEWRPDVIWERSSRLHYSGLTYARKIGVPYVLEWKDHLVDYRFSAFRGKALQLEAQKNREADHVVVESKVLRGELAYAGVDSNKIIVAHNAVDSSSFIRDSNKRTRVRIELGVDDDTVLVGYLGSYAFYHDTGRLVLAADIIRKKVGVGKLKILMVGAGKEYIESRKLAEDKNLFDDILIMKPGVPKNEVSWVLSALDIAVLPGSTDIICPIKIQEYMASELPLVVPDFACNREVIDEGRTGVFFHPGDEHSLASSICALAEDGELRKRVGCEARLEAERRFTWESTWGAAMEEILAKM